ncbi:MAG: transporter ATP-binding protein [Glaciihabitans sp.]|nr:transporter ATP-binding protein [Glaciihabitans sp.]
MKLTKFEHACFVVEKDNQTLVVDPGAFTTPLLDQRGVVAIVVTHEHPDHWTPDQITRILDNNPTAQLFSTAAVAASAPELNFTVVVDGDVHTVGAFELAFYGEKHAEIHRSIPIIDNIGLIVNNAVFYGGDSFTLPPAPVDVLAVPSSAPWLKIGEVIDYITAVAPKRSFSTHEMVNSVIGKNMANDRIKTATAAVGGVFYPLEPGESLEV